MHLRTARGVLQAMVTSGTATHSAPDTPESRRARRTLYLLLATGGIMLAVGTGWGVFFAWYGSWMVAAVDLAMAVLGLAVILTARAHRVRAASWMAFAGLFVLICVFAGVLDMHTRDIPRSTHLFLLVLAACAHHVFRTEAPWLRYGCVLVFLAAFVVFAAVPGGLQSGYVIPDSVRRIGVWVNLLTVAASLLVVLYLAESDSDPHRLLHAALRDALSSRRFELFYQPQLDENGRIFGAEALLRWRHPKRGIVAPGDFMRAAEETGFILPLGQWALSAACDQLRAWQQRPTLSHLRLSLNISPLQLQQSDFVAQVLDALKHSGADPRLLTLELTESVLLRDVEGATRKMHALHAAGVRLSLDDFGTGYSSLSYLRKMPLSELKIDRAFVAEVTHDGHAASITRNLLQLGHDLGIDVIAEGIEHPAQYHFLLGQGCGLFQGYLFGKPMEISAFNRLLDPA